MYASIYLTRYLSRVYRLLPELLQRAYKLCQPFQPKNEKEGRQRKHRSVSLSKEKSIAAVFFVCVYNADWVCDRPYRH